MHPSQPLHPPCDEWKSIVEWWEDEVGVERSATSKEDPYGIATKETQPHGPSTQHPQPLGGKAQLTGPPHLGTTYKGVLHPTHGIPEDAQPGASPTLQPQALAVTLQNPNPLSREEPLLTLVTKDTEVPGQAQPMAQLLHRTPTMHDNVTMHRREIARI